MDHLNCKGSSGNPTGAVFTPEVLEAELLGLEAFNIVPNPNNGEFTMNIELLHEQAAIVRIFSLTGQLVFNDRYELQGSSNSRTIFLNNLSKGVYTVQLILGDGVNIRKMVIH